MTAPEIGTDEWYQQRSRIWNSTALDLITKISEYEDSHPDDAICLRDALIAAGEATHQYFAKTWGPR